MKLHDINPQLFWNKVKVAEENQCWEWQAGCFSSGYGMLAVNRYPQKAHRVSWILSFGFIPKGKHVLHICDNRRCVNPNHLYLGTHQDNMRDMDERGRRNHDLSYYLRGERHPNAKLTQAQVDEIKNSTGIGQRKLAVMYGVSHGAIRHIRSGRTWK